MNGSFLKYSTFILFVFLLTYSGNTTAQEAQADSVRSSIIIKAFELGTADTLASVAIYIEQSYFGQTDTNGILKRAVFTGQYKFEARKPGYKPESRVFKVGAKTDSIEFLLSKTVGINISTDEIRDAIVIVENLVRGKTPLNIPSITLGKHSFQIIKEGYTIVDTLINVEHDSQFIHLQLQPYKIDFTENVEIFPDSVELTISKDNYMSNHSYKLEPKTEITLKIISSQVSLKSSTAYFNNDRIANDRVLVKKGNEIEITNVNELNWKRGPNLFQLFIYNSGRLNQIALLLIEGVTKEYPFKISIDPLSVRIDSSISGTDYYHYFLDSVKVKYSGPIDIRSTRFLLNSRDITEYFKVTDISAILIRDQKEPLQLLYEDYNIIEASVRDNKRNFLYRDAKYSFPRRLHKLYRDLTNYKNYFSAVNVEPKLKVNSKKIIEITGSLMNFQFAFPKESLGVFDTFNNITFHLAPIVGSYFSSLPRSRTPSDELVKDDDWGALSSKVKIQAALEGNRRANKGFELAIFDEVEVFYFSTLTGQAPPPRLKKFLPAPFAKNFIGFNVTNLNHTLYHIWNGASVSIGIGYNGLHPDNKFPRFRADLFFPFKSKNGNYVPFVKLEVDTDFSAVNADIKISAGFNTIVPWSFF